MGRFCVNELGFISLFTLRVSSSKLVPCSHTHKHTSHMARSNKPSVVLDKKQVYAFRKAVMAIEHGNQELAEAYALAAFTPSAAKNVVKYLAAAKAQVAA